MNTNIFLKLLLAPISLLYGLAVGMRNFSYQTKIVKRSRFDLPVINVGNLSIGGNGKTPHVEYLVNMLRPYLDIAVLSRGYKRKTKGFRLVKNNGNANDFGDEPLQIKRKYSDILVAVSESRALAIPEILKHKPSIQTILLDDAFQHLAVEPSLNILLSDSSQLFSNDYLLPSGRLREWRNAYKRADIIIATKCKKGFDETDRDKTIENIKPLPHQKIFFTEYKYYHPYNIYNPSQRITIDEDTHLLLVSAIANTQYLEAYLETLTEHIKHVQFEDHHYFTEHEMSQIKLSFEDIPSEKKVLICSEKDAIRLDLHRKFLFSNQVPIFALPIRVQFLFNEGPIFDGIIKEHLLNFKI